MRKGVVLVDFDNVFYGVARTAGVIQSRIDDFVVACLEATPELEHLDVRLYGGWKTNAQYTAQASTVMGCLESVNSALFPYIWQKRRVTGNVELATSQYNLGIEWENTMQEKGARHMLSVRPDATRHCNHNPDECPLHMVAKATRGQQVNCPLDPCESIDVSQLVRMEQKMVDSMMTCDILEYIHDEDCSAVEVVSDDMDLHPAMALAGERYAEDNDVKLLLMVGNRKNSEQYKRVLERHHIQIRTWQ